MSNKHFHYWIETASSDDVRGLYELQQIAFLTEAVLYQDFKISPLLETPEEILFQLKDHIFLKAISEKNHVVGSIRGFVEKGVCHVRRLAVHPDARRQGIGEALMRSLEDRSPVHKFELFTGARSIGNIRLYERLGYWKVGESMIGDIGICHMEKVTLNTAGG